ncbi:MAG: sulfotransferase [Wenzhouxiangellaceae bacterium]|nr:sulfotransferase [Wenzhouxiangellaceae bacterium]
MLRLFLTGQWYALRLWLQAWISPWRERRSFIGAASIVVLWPAFVALQWLHLAGFALDELLFRGWRRVAVRQPLFVLGPPRSGTTHLHHVLALDETTTTFRLWECLFGLSVTGRKLALALTAADRRLGRPGARLLDGLAQRVNQGMSDVHPFALDAPEEDFLVLMPVMQCFILVTLFPRAEWLWDTARLDRQDNATRRRLMRYYRICVQKHLYTFGPDQRFLSKNASFSGMAESLLETFPDAHIIACDRDPLATVPSQLSSLRPALQASGFAEIPAALQRRLIDLLAFYYLHLDRVAQAHPANLVIVDNTALKQRLAETVRAAFAHLKRESDKAFHAALATADRASRDHRSAHHYGLAEFGLDKAELNQRLAAVIELRRRRQPCTVAQVDG